MCILIAKEKGAQFPPLNHIQNAMTANRDGFAIAWNECGQVKTFKTMNATTMFEKYISLTERLDPRTTGMIFHARIATHGSLGIANCHCWTSFKGNSLEMAFAHNGILQIPNRDDMTDSETFLRDYFEPCFYRGGWNWAFHTIRKHIGTSKFAFLDRSGDIHHYGNYITDNGVLYSNTSYQGYRFARYADPRRWNGNKCSLVNDYAEVI